MRRAPERGAVPEITCASFEQFKRELVEPSLSRNNGRLIKTTGDGASDEFASPLAAVASAMETRRSLRRDVATQ
jgi:adenylate cyclase